MQFLSQSSRRAAESYQLYWLPWPNDSPTTLMNNEGKREENSYLITEVKNTPAPPYYFPTCIYRAANDCHQGINNN